MADPVSVTVMAEPEPPQAFRIDAAARVHAVIGALVERLAAGGAQQAADVMVAESDELSVQVAFEALLHDRAEVFGGAGDQLLEGFEESARLFFFTRTGEEGA